MKINVVYRNMPVDSTDWMPTADPTASVRWTRVEAEEAEVVVYFNYYSYRRQIAAKHGKRFRILYVSEPMVVAPDQYRSAVWRKFDQILTWCEPMLLPGSPISYLPVTHFDYPFAAGHGVISDPASLARAPRRKAIVQVCGDKRSLIAGELYSERRRLARWFHKHGKIPMDVFGRPPMKVPNYRGTTDDKLATLSQYRYALCFENNHDAIWSKGYISEKLFDCFYALTIPVYLGAPNVEDHVPADCFIDFRQFDNNPAHLHDHLVGLSDNECETYRQNILAFLARHGAPERYSCFRLYERAAELYREAGSHAEGSPHREPIYPRDYLQTEPSVLNRLRFRMMSAAVRLHRFVPLMLVVTRRLRPY